MGSARRLFFIFLGKFNLVIRAVLFVGVIGRHNLGNSLHRALIVLILHRLQNLHHVVVLRVVDLVHVGDENLLVRRRVILSRSESISSSS